MLLAVICENPCLSVAKIVFSLRPLRFFALFARNLSVFSDFVAKNLY